MSPRLDLSERPASTDEEKSAFNSLLWRTTTEEIGDTPYRSATVEHTERTRLGKVVGFIESHRRAFAAVGIVASVAIGVRAANAILEKVGPQKHQNLSHVHNEKDLVTPYVEMGSIKMDVDANLCLRQNDLNCQIDLGNGSRPLNANINPADIATSSFKKKK